MYTNIPFIPIFITLTLTTIPTLIPIIPKIIYTAGTATGVISSNIRSANSFILVLKIYCHNATLFTFISIIDNLKSLFSTPTLSVIFIIA